MKFKPVTLDNLTQYHRIAMERAVRGRLLHHFHTTLAYPFPHSDTVYTAALQALHTRLDAQGITTAATEELTAIEAAALHKALADFWGEAKSELLTDGKPTKQRALAYYVSDLHTKLTSLLLD